MEKDNNTKKVILLVDDDEIHLQITELVLSEFYEIHTVKSGKEALEFLNKGQNVPDLMLLDILMPEMDGWSLYDKIVDIVSLKFTPIMFYSSLDENNAKERAYALGAVDFITKPCERPVLLERIGKAIQNAELKKKQYGI